VKDRDQSSQSYRLKNSYRRTSILILLAHRSYSGQGAPRNSSSSSSRQLIVALVLRAKAEYKFKTNQTMQATPSRFILAMSTSRFLQTPERPFTGPSSLTNGRSATQEWRLHGQAYLFCLDMMKGIDCQLSAVNRMRTNGNWSDLMAPSRTSERSIMECCVTLATVLAWPVTERKKRGYRV